MTSGWLLEPMQVGPWRVPRTWCGHEVQFKPEWHRTMITMNVAQKRTWGTGHQERVADCCVWVEIATLWFRGHCVWCVCGLWGTFYI